MMLNPQAPPFHLPLHYYPPPSFPHRYLPPLPYNLAWPLPPPPALPPHFPCSPSSTFLPVPKHAHPPLYYRIITVGYPAQTYHCELKPRAPEPPKGGAPEADLSPDYSSTKDGAGASICGALEDCNKTGPRNRCRNRRAPAPGTCRAGEGKKRVWVPKASSEASPEASRDQFMQMAETVLGRSEGGVTVMIRNIPNKYSREMLMEVLDRQCRDENSGPENGSAAGYDFLYLPIDFRQKGNLGYAFVNFTSMEAAAGLYSRMHGRKWEAFQSQKICCVCFARIQGKESLVFRFVASRFACESEEFLPATFDPPRDGVVAALPVTVGFRVRSKASGLRRAGSGLL